MAPSQYDEVGREADAGRKLAVALVGLGHAGRTLHLPALVRAGFEVRIACDTDASARADLPVVTTADLDEALDADVDAVVVATPPATHADITMGALRRGLHVYVEKPMATSSSDARVVAETAAQASRAVQVGFAYRYHPLWVRLALMRRHGRLPGPLQFVGCFDAPRGALWAHPFLTVACHHVDLVGMVLGASPAEVEVLSDDRLTVRWADGSSLLGRYGEGPGRDEVVVTGGGRTVRVDRRRGVRLRGAGVRSGCPAPALLRAMPGITGWERSFELALRSFHSVCSGVGSPSPDAWDGLVAVRVAESVLRAQQSGCPETVT